MRSSLLPFALAAVVTALIGVGVAMEPYFAGDVALARQVQSLSADPGWWANPISRLAPAPANYYVMVVAAVLAFVLAGWRGLLIAAGFIALEQYGAESTKAWFSRPRPPRDLLIFGGGASGFSFPSTTMTFFAVTFGTLAVLAARVRKSPPVWAILAGSSLMLVLGGLARVALGVHWPSDVILTTVICLSWLWTTARVVIKR